MVARVASTHADGVRFPALAPYPKEWVSLRPCCHFCLREWELCCVCLGGQFPCIICAYHYK